MQIIQQLEVLRSAVVTVRKDGGTLALVPTMGALHEGHLALVREAKQAADHVAVSIFVNPRQFGPNEDLDNYPRQFEQDAQLLREEGVTLLWAPDTGIMYPPDHMTNVSVAGPSHGLCGASRPGHFDGVAIVVLKLFNQVRPDCAFFGEKDWQQLAVIRRMARDLDLMQPSADAIRAVHTVREADGLAMSSRNAYLSAGQRAQAAVLPQAMEHALGQISGGAPVAEALEELRATLLNSGFASVDYAELRAGDTLRLLNSAAPEARLFVAARIGLTRLIDNMPLVQS